MRHFDMDKLLDRIYAAERNVRLTRPQGGLILVVSDLLLAQLSRLDAFYNDTTTDKDRGNYLAGMEVVCLPGISEFAVLSKWDVEVLANAVGGILLTGEQLLQFNDWCQEKIRRELKK